MTLVLSFFFGAGVLVGVFVAYHVKPRKYDPDEQWLVAQAIDDRVDKLAQRAIYGKSHDENYADIKTLQKVRKHFNTDLWR